MMNFQEFLSVITMIRFQKEPEIIVTEVQKSKKNLLSQK